MLCVPTYVAPSPIAGMGLFSSGDIGAGQVIWEYTEGVDWKITPVEFDAFPEPYRSKMRHYVYREESGLFVLCGDNAKYMNHSDDPNCDDSGHEYTRTRYPVRAGEELTCDYRAFDVDAKNSGICFPPGVASTHSAAGV